MSAHRCTRALAHVVPPAVAALICAACAHPVLRPTGPQRFPARAANCEFQLLAVHPGPGYVEVAQISIEGDRSAGTGQYRNAQEFADKTHTDICAVGGDALVTEVNGMGLIVRGIVFHELAQPAQPPPPPAGTSTSGPAASGICEPICSPGFACDNGTCIPQCNPACIDGESCGRDRLCHPKS